MEEYMVIAGIEAGGTKFVCGVGTDQGEVLERISFPTTLPGDTIRQAVEYLKSMRSKHPWQSIGLASFGPIDLHPDSSTYGFITSTPKLAWQQVDIVGVLEKALGTQVRFDTDVNAAALAEQRWGAARGKESVVYITVGTGIGGGALINGRVVHGILHPEMGHMPIRSMSDFQGICPFHKSCLEGLASGPAMQARWGVPADQLPVGHPAWQEEADHIAQGLVSIITILSPEIIVLGGGVMNQVHLLPLVRKSVQELLNGYIDRPELNEKIDQYIVPAGLSSNAGLLGAMALTLG
jgi:fructokinase